jgi:hypothetical protein
MDIQYQELLKQMHAQELRIVARIEAMGDKWHTEVTGIERRLQLEIHKLSLDVNARIDRITREAADRHIEVHKDHAKDNGAKFMAAISVLITIALTFAQFMGARLVP